jgi:hypothetical protein
MSDVISLPAVTAMSADRLSESRKEKLATMVHEVQIYSRRAKTPEDKIALAEIEHELIEITKRWERAGLINGQEELPLAAEAPAPR